MNNMKIKNDSRYKIDIVFILGCSLAAAAISCSIESGKAGGESGLQFAFTTTEMGDEVVSIGAQRRAAYAGTPDEPTAS